MKFYYSILSVLSQQHICCQSGCTNYVQFVQFLPLYKQFYLQGITFNYRLISSVAYCYIRTPPSNNVSNDEYLEVKTEHSHNCSMAYYAE